MTLALFLQACAWLAAGLAAGAFHFLTLRTSARRLATGASFPAAMALHLIRFPVTAGALILVARHGALPLCAATLGILTARTAMVRAAVRTGLATAVGLSLPAKELVKKSGFRGEAGNLRFFPGRPGAPS